MTKNAIIKNESLRYNFVDILKGILIIMVVIGHSNAPYRGFLFWFHMPAFFMVSGFLNKEITVKDFYSKIFQKIQYFFIPYFSYYLLIIFLIFGLGLHQVNLDWLQFYIPSFFLGGTYLAGDLTVFWFIPTLVFVYIFFNILKLYIKYDVFIIGIVTLLFCLAHYFSPIYLSQQKINITWWDWRYMGVSTMYFMIGYHGRILYQKYVVRSMSWVFIA
ncbi:MAG: acyltransferase family protein, partial [Candidatus Roizmanbacteria bacterium]